MGSSSGPSARGTYYTHSSWYNGSGNEYGEVHIRSKRGIGLFSNGVVMEVIFMHAIIFLLILAYI